MSHRMSEGDDLKKFREHWVDELKYKKPKYATNTGEEQSQDSDDGLELGDNETQTANTSSEKPVTYDTVTSTDNHSSIPAFEIINSCFKSRSSVSDTFNPNCDSLLESKEISNHDRELFNNKHRSLLDVLISDIDEVTGIPFFDLELPKEVAIRIFSYFSVIELLNCCRVNKAWKLLAEDDLLWFDLCKDVGIDTGVTSSAAGSQWKTFAKYATLTKGNTARNWKERICQITQLEYDPGGILCSASFSGNHIIAGYLDGSVIVWNIHGSCQQTRLNPGCRNASTEELTSKFVVDTSVDKHMCAASFANGDVIVWQTLHDASIVHQRLSDDGNCSIKINAGMTFEMPMLMTARKSVFNVDTADGMGCWRKAFTNVMDSEIIHFERIAAKNCLVTTSESLNIVTETSIAEMERSVGAVISAVDVRDAEVACGIHYKGFHVVGGFRVKLFCLTTGKLKQLLQGPHCSVSCLNLKSSPANIVIVGCSDFKLRIFDTRMEHAVNTFYAQQSRFTYVQMDDYKVVSGSMNGSVCVWDQRRTTTHLWEHQVKHPIRVCTFDSTNLVVADIPIDHAPQESLWYIDDLTQHRRLRGSISLFDFNSNSIVDHVPDICHSTYEDTAGYNYNIELVTPFDDISAGNWPQV